MIDSVTIPEGGFRTILADPPWRFQTWSAKGAGKSASQHYQTMPMAGITTLPVREIVAKDAALFLWATWPTIFAAQAVIDAWGFTFSGLAWEWIKRNPATGKYAFGCGYGTRKNVEPCLLARRGKPTLKSRSVRDFLYAPRREHSRKPDEQYSRIESMFDGPYLELFSRTDRAGWASWGKDAGKFGEAA